MKLELVEAVNAYDVSEWILEKDMNIDLAFRFAEMVEALRDKKQIFLKALEKVKVVDNIRDPEELNVLCRKVVEAEIPRITATELKEEFDKVPPKVILSLLPVLVRDDKESESESTD